MRTFLLAVSIFMIGLQGNAQDGYKRVQNRMLDEAEFLLANDEYQEALKIYRRLYPADTSFIDVRYGMAMCMANIPGLRDQAAPHLEYCANAGHTESNYQLALAKHRQLRFDEAIVLLDRYQQIHGRAQTDMEVDRRREMARNAKQYVAAPVDLMLRNLGPGINTAAHDYCPLITADGNTLYLTSRREGTTGSKRDASGQYLEDVYMARRIDLIWSNAVNVNAPINTELQDATVGLDPTGEALIIYRTSEDLVSGDLYSCAKDGNGGWAEPQRMCEQINSTYHEPSASIAPSGQEIYFTSDRPGGYGGRDIWRVRMLPNGEWSLPLNLGPTVNTRFDEDAPFVHSDGTTLFFSSNGHRTMGGYDIFKSTLLDHDMNVWSDPENMGYPLNTVNDDIYFCLSEDGYVGYFSSERPGGLGAQDIYEVEFPSSVLSKVVVHGLVTDELEQPLKARMIVKEASRDEVIGVYTSNENTGRFLMVLEPGQQYAITTEASGFPVLQQAITAPEGDGLVEMDHEITLTHTKGVHLSRNEP